MTDVLFNVHIWLQLQTTVQAAHATMVEHVKIVQINILVPVKPDTAELASTLKVRSFTSAGLIFVQQQMQNAHSNHR